MAEWQKSKYKGLRYREHETRTIGVGRSKRPLRYYVMTYKWQDKTISEAFGWEGDYIRDVEQAYDICRALSNNRKDKTPPFTLKNYREDNEIALESAKAAEQEQAARNITFGEIFREHYFPQVQHNRRSQRSIRNEEALYRIWIGPVIGERPMREIKPLHLEMIKKDMLAVKRSALSIEYCLAVIRQVFNYTNRNNIFTGKNP